jgi:NitT/TauT family transport system substrate-binding protein
VSSLHVRSGVLRRSVSSVALVIATVASLAACSSSGSGGTTVKKDSTGTVSITVLRSTGSTFEPLYIAQDQGYFKAAGLNVTIKPGAADTSQNAPSVINGEAQFAMTDSSGFLKAAAQGLPVQLVSGLQSSTTTTAPSDGLVVKASSPIKSFADVEGKTIALPALGGTLQFISEYSAKAAGADPAKIKFVALPLPSLNAAVASGKVDGAYLFATFLDAAKAAGMRTIGMGTNALPGLPQALLFGSSKFLSTNPAVAKKFEGAVAKAIDYANNNGPAVRAVDTKYTKLPPAYIAGRTIQKFSADINTAVIKTVADGMLEFKLITKPVNTDSLYSAAVSKVTTSN